MAMSLLAYAARQLPRQERSTQFDTDSAPIGIDNCCSGCISHVISDFDGPLRNCNRTIKGFGGQRVSDIQIGTLHWKWQDDQGAVHSFRIPDSYYVPQGKVRLLSPQHWAQAQRDHKPLAGTGKTTTANSCTLFWNQRKYQLRVPIGRYDNVATFHLAPGYAAFDAFCQEARLDPTNDSNPLVLSNLISDDKGDDPDDNAPDIPRASRSSTWKQWWTPGPTESPPAPTEFHLDGPSPTSEREDTPNDEYDDRNANIIVDEEEEFKLPLNDMAELLQLHHQFGHVSFRKLQEMAKQGIFPKRLAKCQVPACSACMYAKATKRRWQDKTSKNVPVASKPTKPGQVVSVDQLVSPTKGLIAQMTGFLSKQRYEYATVYVDQYSRLGYVYLQKTAMAEETLEGKRAFELYAASHGVKILNYHADNGIFKAHKWVESCIRERQGLTFAGVNAHHQNGIAEKRIRDLQDMSRTQLIHASKRWPVAVTANLWPYALRASSMALNNTASFQNESRRSPLELFSNTRTATNPKHWKPFGCPVYVLEDKLQTNDPSISGKSVQGSDYTSDHLPSTEGTWRWC